MFSTMLFICIVQWPCGDRPPVARTGTVLRGLHKMPRQGVLARGGRRVGGKGSKTDFPESATPSEVSMKLHSCGAHNRSRAGFGAPTPPDMTLTPRAMASSPSPLAGSLAAILLPLCVPILGSGRHQASSRALPSPSWGESAKMTSRTG